MTPLAKGVTPVINSPQERNESDRVRKIRHRDQLLALSHRYSDLVRKVFVEDLDNCIVPWDWHKEDEERVQEMGRKGRQKRLGIREDRIQSLW